MGWRIYNQTIHLFFQFLTKHNYFSINFQLFIQQTQNESCLFWGIYIHLFAQPID